MAFGKSYALVNRLNSDIAETTERYQSLLQAEETKLQNDRKELKSLERAP